MIQQECGVTDISRENAAELIRMWGKPVQLDFKADTKKGDYFVTLRWADSSSFILSGFAWGYGGTGPNALQELLTSLGITDLTMNKIPVDQFGKTDCSYRFDGKFTA